MKIYFLNIVTTKRNSVFLKQKQRTSHGTAELFSQKLGKMPHRKFQQAVFKKFSNFNISNFSRKRYNVVNVFFFECL